MEYNKLKFKARDSIPLVGAYTCIGRKKGAEELGLDGMGDYVKAIGFATYQFAASTSAVVLGLGALLN